MYANQENIDKLQGVQVTKVPPTTTGTMKLSSIMKKSHCQMLTKDGTGAVPSHAKEADFIREEGEPCKYAVAQRNVATRSVHSARSTRLLTKLTSLGGRLAFIAKASPFTLIARQGNT